MGIDLGLVRSGIAAFLQSVRSNPHLNAPCSMPHLKSLAETVESLGQTNEERARALARQSGLTIPVDLNQQAGLLEQLKTAANEAKTKLCELTDKAFEPLRHVWEEQYRPKLEILGQTLQILFDMLHQPERFAS